MKPNLAITALLLTAATACQQNANTTTEVAQKRQELESKRQELKDKKEIAALSEEMKSVEAEILQVDQSNPGSGEFLNPYINGQNVTMRASNSAQSAKIGTFKPYETVTVLQTANAQNTNEAILKQGVSLSTQSGEYVQLPSGKAVRLGNFDRTAKAYHVTFDYPGKGTLSGNVAVKVLDLSEKIWHRVRRANGTEGWVLGKFVAEGNTGEECGL